MNLNFISRIEAFEAKVNQLLQESGTSESRVVSIEPRPHEDLCEKVPPPIRMNPQTSDPSFLGRSGDERGEFPVVSDTDPVAAGLLTMEEANTLLDAFRTLMTSRFPFVCIPHQQTAEGLKRQKPFLFLDILAPASYENMPLQRALGKKVKQAISLRMILTGRLL